MRYLILLMLIPGLFAAFPAAARTLDLATAQALTLRNQAALQQRRELLAGKQAEARAAQSDRWSRLELKAGYNHFKDKPFERFNGTEIVVNDRDLFHYQLDLIQPLFTGYALSARENLARLEVDLAAFDLAQVRSDLLLETNMRYLDLLDAEERLRLADEEMAQLEQHRKDAQALFDQGLIPPNDLLKAEVALAQAKLKRRQVRSDRQLAASRLALLVGLPRGEELELAEPVLTLPTELPAEQLEAAALRDRPELAAARQAIQAAGERQRIAESRFYPRLNLVGSYQRTGNDIATSENPYRNKDNASIGLQLDWNLFSSGADRQRSIAARHQVAAGRQALASLEDQVRFEVEAALEKLEVARQNQQTAATALKQAQENHHLSTLQFRENLISTSDLLDARTLLTRAETELRVAHFNDLRAQSLLLHAIGRLTPAGENL